MINKLEEEINNCNEEYFILKENVYTSVNAKDISKSIITIRQNNLILDGKNKKIEINIEGLIDKDLSFINIHMDVSKIEIKNINILIRINSSFNSQFLFTCIYSQCHNFKIVNSNIEVISNKQINIRCLYIHNLFDNLISKNEYIKITDTNINVFCFPDDYPYDCFVYGIYNEKFNSISIQNTNIKVVNKGLGLRQIAIGIYTNGRFGRILGNNIKANSSHQQGLNLEQGFSCALINEGPYSIISNNNLIAEWAGKTIGLENKRESSIITGNKISVTHTIYGIGIKSKGNKAIITNNVILSTSKNSRLIDHYASDSIINNNCLEALLPPSECISGVGIYASYSNIGCNTISNNIICKIKNCGIFSNSNIGVFFNNLVVSNDEAFQFIDTDNKKMSEILNENNIKSIRGDEFEKIEIKEK